MKLGICASTKGNTAEVAAVAAALHADLFVWMSDCHRPSDAQQHPDATHIVRLRNALPGETAASYLGHVAPAIGPWIAAGIKDLWFQPGNEPDVRGYDLGQEWTIPQWKGQARAYVSILRANFPGIRLLSVPFSVGNIAQTDQAYVDGYDGAAVHFYWDAAGGVPPHTLLNFSTPGPLYFTELNSNPTDPHEVASFIATMHGVDGVAIFMADAPAEFAHYDLSPLDAGAIRALLFPPLPPPPPSMSTTPYSGDSSPIGGASAVPGRWKARIAQGNTGEAQAIVDAYQLYAPVAGINADLALAQACLETGYFTSPAWRNFKNPAGIGITGTNVSGPNFDLIASDAGIKAHLELLRNYFVAGGSLWGVLAGFGLGFDTSLGKKKLSDLDGVWAVPGVGYGQRIADIANGVVGGAAVPPPAAVVPSTPPPPAPGVTLEQCYQIALAHVGNALTDEGNPEFGMCEQFVEEVYEQAGLGRTRRPSAAVHGDELTAAGRFHQGPPMRGAGVVWGRAFDPNGHIAIAGSYPEVVTTHVSGKIARIDGTAWYAAAGYLGWYIPEGAVASVASVASGPPHMDDGLIQWVWEAHNVVYNPTAGIFQDWKKRVYTGGEPLGVPVRNEKSFDNGARIEQAFSSGKVAQWTRGDNKVVWLEKG